MPRLDLHAAALAHAHESKTGFEHDRSKTVGASEIGRCIRAVAMKKQGVKPDTDHVDDPGFATRGNLIEDGWAAPVLARAAEAAGAKLLWSGQENQTSIVWEKKYASCTPDGLFVGVPRDWLAGLGVKKCSPHVLAEIKSIDPRVSPDRLPKDGHPEQAHFGMGLVRAATEYKPEFALLYYVNCSKLTDQYPLVIAFNESYFARQLARAKKAVTTPWKTLVAEGKIGGGKQCKYCEFQRTCLGKRSSVSADSRVPKTTIINLK